MNRQKLILFIALIVLVLAVIWSVISFPRQNTVTTLKGAPGSLKQQQRVPVVSVAKPADTAAKAASKPPATSVERTLRLDRLEREQSGFKGYRRNIFRPIFTDELKLMKQKASAVKPLFVPPVAVVAQRPVPVPPAVQPAFQPEILQSTLSHFTFLGFLKKGNRKTIFLSKDKEIVLVRKGERFAQHYEATKITDQALTIRATDTGEEIVIPLTENMPLVAVIKK